MHLNIVSKVSNQMYLKGWSMIMGLYEILCLLVWFCVFRFLFYFYRFPFFVFFSFHFVCISFHFVFLVSFMCLTLKKWPRFPFCVYWLPFCIYGFQFSVYWFPFSFYQFKPAPWHAYFSQKYPWNGNSMRTPTLWELRFEKSGKK